mmetsp:Transcript_17380/g.32991  ORF Transcript_17380/g.32991 Transcript_17380/m.32991 type:complete len:112 (+) Transcript_17380:271-606(+)
MIQKRRNGWTSCYHVYDNARRVLMQEWVPRMNAELQTLGYEVDVCTYVQRMHGADLNPLICIRVIQQHAATTTIGNQATAVTYMKQHVGELPARRKTTGERIRDINKAIHG